MLQIEELKLKCSGKTGTYPCAVHCNQGERGLHRRCQLQAILQDHELDQPDKICVVYFRFKEKKQIKRKKLD